MNEFYLQSLLNELTMLKKRITKLGALLYIIPLVFFLLENKVDINLSISVLNLHNSEFILFFIPCVHTGVYFYLVFTGEKSIETFTLIEALAPKDLASKEWLKSVQPEFALSKLFETLSKSHFSTILMLVPMFVLAVVFPLVFQLYSIVRLILISYADGNWVYWVLSVISIILVITVLYYLMNGLSFKELFKRREELIKKLN